MSPRKSEEDVMITFCQNQSFADVLHNRCSSKLSRFQRKKPVLLQKDRHQEKLWISAIVETFIVSLVWKFESLKVCCSNALQYKCCANFETQHDLFKIFWKYQDLLKGCDQEYSPNISHATCNSCLYVAECNKFEMWNLTSIRN